MHYLLFFGRTSALSEAEVTSLGIPTKSITPDIVEIDTESVEIDGMKKPVSELLSLLGGTVKIATVEKIVPEVSATHIAAIIGEQKEASITFGISWYDPKHAYPNTLVSEVKQLLEQSLGHVRFIKPRDGNELSSVVVKGQHITEIHVVPFEGRYILAKTVAVQEVENWNRRDYGRPFADPKSGMLPPKVARMVVNIGLGASGNGKTLMDPFCGMGTILGESIARGVTIIGSDVDAAVVKKATNNMDWLTGNSSHAQFFTCDATHIRNVVHPETIDVIVTEPYMGPTALAEKGSADVQRVQNIFKGLEKLYIGCFREWHEVLKPGGRIVMAIPSFFDGKRTIIVKKVIDTCEKLGYTKLLGPLPYSRPQAVIRREFYVFEKK